MRQSIGHALDPNQNEEFETGQGGLSSKSGTAEDSGRKLVQFCKDVLRFLWKEDRLSGDFNLLGVHFQMVAAATEKARLLRFSLVLG